MWYDIFMLASLSLELLQKVEIAKERILLALQEEATALAFSGGKDSTVLLLLALEVVRETSFELNIVHCDTLVENPSIREHCDRFLEELQLYAEREGLPVRVHIAYPVQTFWVSLIGKGYPLPYHKFRWCQKSLKIEPTQKLLRRLGIRHILTAVREEESSSRKVSIKRNYDHIRRRKGLPAIAPLLEWTTEDVWEFLSSCNCEWTDLRRIYELYRNASGECPIVGNVDWSTACGARFGCWVCTLASDDRALLNQSRHDEKLRLLYHFRKWLIEFCNRPENRTGKNRKGKPVGEGKGQLTSQARQEILRRLLELQERIGMELIRDWEIKKIKEEWGKEHV